MSSFAITVRYKGKDLDMPKKFEMKVTGKESIEEVKEMIEK